MHLASCVLYIWLRIPQALVVNLSLPEASTRLSASPCPALGQRISSFIVICAGAHLWVVTLGPPTTAFAFAQPVGIRPGAKCRHLEGQLQQHGSPG